MPLWFPDTSDVLDYEGGQCIVQIGYNRKDGAYYPAESEGYYAWASTFQTIGTVNANPVGKCQVWYWSSPCSSQCLNWAAMPTTQFNPASAILICGFTYS